MTGMGAPLFRGRMIPQRCLDGAIKAAKFNHRQHADTMGSSRALTKGGTMRCGIIDVAPDTPGSIYSSQCPFEEKRVGAAAVYCSDGGFGEAMDEFLHEGLALPHYDRVAIPGGAACLAGHTCAYHQKNALERQLEFLI